MKGVGEVEGSEESENEIKMLEKMPRKDSGIGRSPQSCMQFDQLMLE